MSIQSRKHIIVDRLTAIDRLSRTMQANAGNAFCVDNFVKAKVAPAITEAALTHLEQRHVIKRVLRKRILKAIKGWLYYGWAVER